MTERVGVITSATTHKTQKNASNCTNARVYCIRTLNYPPPPEMCVLSQYERGRELADFVKFLNDKCGTNRLPGGKLNSHVRPPLS